VKPKKFAGGLEMKNMLFPSAFIQTLDLFVFKNQCILAIHQIQRKVALEEVQAGWWILLLKSQ